MYIHYQDARGRLSSRLIIPNSIEPVKRNDYSIRAFCQEKNEIRAFRYSRIKQLTNAETGEVLHDILQYFSNHTENPRLSNVLHVFKLLQHEITVLVFSSTYKTFWSENKIDKVSKYIQINSKTDLDLSYIEVELRRTGYGKSDFIHAVLALSQKPLNYKRTLFAFVVDLIEEDIEPVDINHKLISFLMHRWKLK